MVDRPPDRLPDAILALRERLPRKPAPVVLTGPRVELRPLVLETDVEPLHAISCGAPCSLGTRHVDAYDPDERIWRWMKGGPFRDAGGLREYLAKQVEAADMLPMTVRDRETGAPIGVAAFMSNHPEDLKLELGSIWYGPIAQGTGASREATHLLLGHAFGLGYRRVEWKCDTRNERSRAAALSYGFRFEGIQDAHYIVKGRNRDTAWYRIVDTEWPAAQARSRTM